MKSLCGLKWSLLCPLDVFEDLLRCCHLSSSYIYAGFIFWRALSLQPSFSLACLIEVALSSFEVEMDGARVDLSPIEMDLRLCGGG